MTGGVLVNFLLVLLAVMAAVVIFVFVFVPLVKGFGAAVAWIIRAIGWTIAHFIEYVAGTIGDVIRAVGAVIAMAVFAVLSLFSVVLGRWSAVSHYGDSLSSEAKVLGLCGYRALLRRPLKLFWLHGLLEGIEQRVPEAIAAAPAADRPSKRTGQFEGYTITGSLAAGGSGARLHIAEPSEAVRRRYPSMPQRVVIKSFALSEGSSLPQIVRESRALECAKKLGLVFEHGMEPTRFWYVMPYHPGENLGVITRQLHGETDGTGLDARRMGVVLGFTGDLLRTLSEYHREGLWHKDVKPDNLIIHDGRAHLVDLGLVTPLRSAMTLTTHGTEYFRDPELVRQALRGVKVHEVDGTRFDVYAVGAVLYFMIENEFPAHGALSRFSRRSPDAVKWVVRRAMADYHHRYDSAQAMLADIAAIGSAADPFAVRPADLPSVRGRGEEGESEADAGREYASGPSPFVSPVGAAAAAGAAAVAGTVGGPFGANAANAGAANAGAKSVAAHSSSPVIAVTNWWTGEYAGSRHPGRSMPQPPEGAPWVGVAPAHRKPAREQLTSAQARALSAQRRASKRKVVAPAERMPPAAVLMVTLLVIGATLYFVLGTARVAPIVIDVASSGAVSAPQAPQPPVAPAVARARAGGDAESYDGHAAFVFVVDHAGATDPLVAAKIAEIRAAMEARGATFRDDADLAGRAHAIIASGTTSVAPGGRLENLLLAHDLGGVVHVLAHEPGATGPDTVIYRVYTRTSGSSSAATARGVRPLARAA